MGVLQLHDLKHVVEQTPPPVTLESGAINPDYTTWSKADQLVLTWIRSTVSASVQTMILHCTTAKEAWMLLEKFLSPLCSIHVKALRTKLRNTRKLSNTTMSEYLMEVKTTVDALRAAGSTIQEDEVCLLYKSDAADDLTRVDLLCGCGSVKNKEKTREQSEHQTGYDVCE